MKILLTGAAGFIAFHTATKLLERGDSIVGVDNLNDYYDVKLKKARLEELKKHDNFTFYKADISDQQAMEEIFNKHKFDKVCNLAAQAGVRYSLENPFAYEQVNIKGLLVLLELAKKHNIKYFVGASSSSVYGGNTKMPFSEKDDVSTPISVYAATKRSNELICHVYNHLYGMKCILLRFFTVYGPYGRPDMALFIFTKNIFEGKPIDVFNHGDMQRDFTYVEDIANGTIAAIDSDLDYEIFNLGNNQTRKLSEFIDCIEKETGKKAEKNMMPMQPGDVPKTFADISKAKELLGYDPKTPIEVGIKKFVDWYKKYHKIDN